MQITSTREMLRSKIMNSGTGSERNFKSQGLSLAFAQHYIYAITSLFK